ncbi:hypothetical protein GL213_03305 [Halogeometricum borinquense]|nr:hypothetical protein GL213_03305 [Halogeometricum borinquense]
MTVLAPGPAASANRRGRRVRRGPKTRPVLNLVLAGASIAVVQAARTLYRVSPFSR